MAPVPLSGRVVFVDWHGVLSRDPFWASIRESRTHPLRKRLDASVTRVFSPEAGIVTDWMKGLVSYEQVVDAMGVRLDRRFREDFLARRLLVDVRRMRVNVDLVRGLQRLKSTAMVVLATDNMDCFQVAFARARRPRARRHGRGRAAVETLAYWATVFDDIVCSSEVGALKAEDPVAFFGSFLSRHGLAFEDAALVDDRADNCHAFAERGGHPVWYDMDSGDVGEVMARLEGWLDTPSGQLRPN
jgi:hypothetical protein